MTYLQSYLQYLFMIKIAFDFIFNNHLFRPNYIVDTFNQIVHISRKDNIKFIIFDKDDTLTTLHQFTITDPIILHTINALSKNHIRMSVLSNSIKPKDPEAINNISILRTMTKKPYNKEEIQVIIKDYKCEQVMIIGDRLMTDIYLANLIGCKSILVPQIQQTTINKHGMFVFLLRKLQKVYLNTIKLK